LSIGNATWPGSAPSLQFERPIRPLVFVSVPVLLGAVALFAVWRPAIRGSRVVDDRAALRVAAARRESHDAAVDLTTVVAIARFGDRQTVASRSE
jgi:hypothetical protein